MIDGASVLNVLGQGGLSNLQQLPAPPTQDVMRFESILNQGADSGSTNFQVAGASSAHDTPILQLTGVGNQEASSIKESVMGQVAQIDQSYHSMLNQLGNMPKFNDYLSSVSPSVAHTEMRTYPDVSGAGNGKGLMDQMSSMLQKNQSITQASLDYEGMLSHWSMNSQMWMTKINVISSAVTQVAQGFKTLFRAAG